MNRLWKTIAGAITWLRPRRPGPRGGVEEPRFICRCPIEWESEGQRGRGELRQLSGREMRLSTDRPLLAGRPIRVRPVAVGQAPSLLLDVVNGTVLASRRDRRSGAEVTLQLHLPEKVSRFAWFRLLRRPGLQRREPAPSATARSLRLVQR